MVSRPAELDMLYRRRSVARLVAPAPDADEVREILLAATTAPDHGELRPWRFVVLEGSAKEAFGDVLAEAYVARCAASGEAVVGAKQDKERTKLGRAPLVLVVGVRRGIAATNPKIPWDDVVGAGYAACQNALLAATAMGYGSRWRTGEVTTDAHVKAALGFTEDDVITGFLYIGTPADGSGPPPHQRGDADLAPLTDVWSPPAPF